MNNNFNIDEFLDKLSKKNFGKNLFLFVIGMLISALAFNLVFDRYNIIPTGSSGLALLIANYIPIDISLIIFLVCLILLIMGLIFYGYEYALKMLAVTFIYPFFVTSTTLITKYIDLEDTSLFLLIVIGGAILGLSSGLIRKSGYSPGGFCVIYDLMNQYLHISIGVSTTIINGLLIVASGIINGLNSAIYAIISLLVSSYIVDKVILGISDNKVFYIITDKADDIKNYVISKLGYNVTVINVKGSRKKDVLMCVVASMEYVKLKELAKEIDPNAFFLVVDVYESSVKKICKNL